MFTHTTHRDGDTAANTAITLGAFAGLGIAAFAFGGDAVRRVSATVAAVTASVVTPATATAVGVAAVVVMLASVLGLSPRTMARIAIGAALTAAVAVAILLGGTMAHADTDADDTGTSSETIDGYDVCHPAVEQCADWDIIGDAPAPVETYRTASTYMEEDQSPETGLYGGAIVGYAHGNACYADNTATDGQQWFYVTDCSSLN